MSLIQRHGLLIRVDWTRVATRWLPFADAATPDLPLPRLARLALFQVSVGMATALMVGTLNRVMIVELGVGAWLVALMVALPLLVAPLRALVGFKSDTHRSFLGWKRVPFIWLGTMLQFAGLAIMPFALILLVGATPVQLWSGHIAAAAAFLLAGAGLQIAQTAGLALATDLSREDSRPRVVALMYVMLLIGMVGGATLFGIALADYSHTRLVQVVQGAAVATILLNTLALWKQEPRSSRRAPPRPGERAAAHGSAHGSADGPADDFAAAWSRFAGQPRTRRFLLAVGLGTAAFSMQDVILEPYGGEVLHLPVGATTVLTALMAGGALVAFALAARLLGRGADPYRVAAAGAVAGLVAFAAVIFADPLDSPMLFRAGTLLIGFGGGLFSVGTLTAAMGLDTPAAGQGRNHHGLVLGAWGAVQACCAGAAIALGGVLRDVVNGLGQAGLLGEALAGPGAGYGVVYHLELVLLFATLIAVGPLVRRSQGASRSPASEKFGLADLPG